MIEFKGINEIQTKMQHVINNYPDESEDLLIKMGNKFRTHVKQITPDSGEPSKRKLIKSYRVSKVQGYGKDRYVEFRSTAPHFHLIERGHRIVTRGGMDTGKRVEGKFMVKSTALKFQNGEYPKDVERMVNRMVKKLNG